MRSVTRADYKGKHIAASKGSTSELSVKLNGSEPVTLQDAGSAYMAVQQNKAVGLVGNDPMLLEPVGIDMDKAGEIHQI